MDNQSRSSLWQSFFKQGEWGEKLPEQITFILQRGPRGYLSPRPSLTLPRPCLLHKASQWVQLWAWPNFTSSRVCWTSTADKTSSPAWEKQHSNPGCFFLPQYCWEETCKCVWNFRMQLSEEVSVLLPDGYRMCHTWAGHRGILAGINNLPRTECKWINNPKPVISSVYLHC